MASARTTIANWYKRIRRRGITNLSVTSAFFWRKLLGISLCTLLPILILGLLVVTWLRGSITHMADENNRNHLLQTQSRVELILSEMDSLSLTFSANSDVTTTLSQAVMQENYSTAIREVAKLMRSYLIPPVAARPYIQSLYIYVDNPYGRFLTDTDNLVTRDTFYDIGWLESYERQRQENKQFASELRSLKRYAFEKESTQVITLYKRFFLREGVVVFNLYKRYFDALLADLVSMRGQQLLVVDGKGEVVMQSEPQLLLGYADIERLCGALGSGPFNYEAGRTRYQVSRIRSDLFGWTFLSITPHSQLYAFPDRAMGFMGLVLCAAAAVCLLLSIRHARRSHASIMRVFGLLDAMDKGEEPPSVEVERDDAYAYILHNILRNYAKQNNLKRQLEKKQFEAKTLELSALRAQIHPHFLFNTLQSIYWMSVERMGGPNDVGEMIQNMTSILEYSMESSDPLVPLEQEIRNTKAYIALQHMRYQDRFAVRWHVEAGIERFHTIKLLLQPLLENAITHGVNWEEHRTLNVDVSLARVNGCVAVRMKDDGLGIASEKLEEIRRRLASQSDEGHIGLFSVNRRLCLTFGPEYALEIESTNGTQILIRMPLIGEAE